MRAGRLNLLGLLILLALLVGGVWVFTFGPYYWDHWVMNEVVESAARSWEAFTLERAKQVLVEELENRDVPTYIDEDDCEFVEAPGHGTVHCEWTVQVPWPLIGRLETLHFVSEAEAQLGG